MPESVATAAVTSFADFLSKLKRINVVSATSLEELKNLVKQPGSGLRSVDDAISGLKVSRNKYGLATIESRSVGYVNHILREANLDALIALASRKIPIGVSDRALFSKLIGETPEKALKTVRDASDAAKRTHGTLNVSDVKDLSVSSARDVKTVENNLFKYFKQGTTVALTIGTVYVAVDWIAKATEARKGCFMITTISGKSTSCKIASYSCESGKTGNFCSNVGAYYNTTLCLMAAADLPDTDQRKIELCTGFNVSPSELKKKLASVIDSQFATASSIITNMQADPKKRITPNICTIVHPDIEGGKIPSCRMCSPTDNPVSTTYIDATQYGENITFQCVDKPSILDTISDVVVTTGKDIWQGVSGGLGSALRILLIVLGVFLGLLVILGLGVKYLRGRREA